MSRSRKGRHLSIMVPLIDDGTSLLIETSDLGQEPVLSFDDEHGRLWVFNWARDQYEPEEAIPWLI